MINRVQLPSPKYMPPVGMRHGLTSILSALLSCRNSEEKSIEAELFNGQNIVAFDNGKAALLAALQALAKIQGERVNVIVPAYTCFSMAAVIERAGLRMVLCDILPETLDFDYEMLAGLIDENTLCIVPTHLFGKSADVGKVKKIANLCGAFVIEDSAQALPDVVGQHGEPDVVIYSFGRGKPYSTGGGGLLTSYRKDIIEAVGEQAALRVGNSFSTQISAALKLFLNDLLISPYIYWLPASLPFLKIGKTIYPDYIEIDGMINFKKTLIDSLTCKYSDLSEGRHIKMQYYHQTFKSSGIPEKIVHLGEGYYKPIRYPFYLQKNVNDLSDDMTSKMARLGIVKMYPCGLHRLKQVQPFWVNKKMEFPGADWIAGHLLSLPVHPLVTERHQTNVINCIRSCILK